MACSSLQEHLQRGQQPLIQDQAKVDKEASNLWLRREELFPETKGFVVAIQEKVIVTRKYQKHILTHNVDDEWRLSGIPMEPSNTLLIVAECWLKESTHAGTMMCVELFTNK